MGIIYSLVTAGIVLDSQFIPATYFLTLFADYLLVKLNPFILIQTSITVPKTVTACPQMYTRSALARTFRIPPLAEAW